jgi:hypothetical protein
LADECGPYERVEVCDVGPTDGKDRDAVLVLGLGSRVEVVADELCAQRLGVRRLVNASVRGVRVERGIDVPGAQPGEDVAFPAVLLAAVVGQVECSRA